MSAPTDSPSACSVRPPWPDELPRLAEAFPGARINRTVALHPLVLIAPGSPERIVGFAGVLAPVDGEAGLACALRARYIDSPDGDRLISAALQLAQTVGARSVRLVRQVPPGDPLRPALVRAAFAFPVTGAPEGSSDGKSANPVWAYPERG